jgi:cytochrome c oxidase subunit 5b
VTDFEHSTGLYRAELEGLAQGKDIFDHYDFTRAPKGTKESPCVVTSEMEYRVVGVTDPDDDSIVIWGRLEEGKGPMLIGDEWFVHKRVGGGGGHWERDIRAVFTRAPPRRDETVRLTVVTS